MTGAILGLLQGLLKLSGALAAYARDKQLMDAGEAKFIVRSLEEQNALLTEVRAARSHANDSDGLSDDGFRRKDEDG